MSGSSATIIKITVCLFLVISVVKSQSRQTAEVVHDISSQARCGLVYGLVSTDCRWESGLSFNADQEILGGRIAAYKILWPKGWGLTWYVPGINDLDGRYNVYGNALCSYEKKRNSMRRKWAFFTSYPHMYILCKHREDNPERSRDNPERSRGRRT